jgi:uncharacterized Ntn-hydrolase superfamily protein
MRRGTYSIVARDPSTGALGVAVHSHWFSVGSMVPWAEPGLGAVATQSLIEPAYGPRALARLRAGEAAHPALAALVAADAEADVRQVAVVDAGGEVAVHTGGRCIPAAGHITGGDFSCQANMMARAGVPEAMADGFTRAAGVPLAQRLLAALDAAEAAGGDVRGRQSSALLVVPAEGEPWRRVTDLRVEDHPEPLAELRRLEVLHRAYREAGQGDALAALGRHAEAAARYRAAAALAPASDELLFWAGLGQARDGDVEGGAARVAQAIARQPGWADLLARLAPDLAPSAAAVRRALSGRPAAAAGTLKRRARGRARS